MSARIYIQTQFEAQHRWKDAPKAQEFLRNWHRHIFHVKVAFAVTHNERQIEFFEAKHRVDDFIRDNFAKRQFELSCEAIAEHLLIYFRAQSVEVSEDGENGAVVECSSNPALNSISRLFIGKECEGPNQGQRVLFVPGSLCSTLPRMRMMLTSPEFKAGMKYKPERVYLGAGNERCGHSYPDVYGVALLQKECGRLPIDIEFDFFDSLAAFVGSVGGWGKKEKHGIGSLVAFGFEEPIDVRTIPPDLRERVFMKHIANDTIVWEDIMGTGSYGTWLKHPWFGQDTIL